MKWVEKELVEGTQPPIRIGRRVFKSTDGTEKVTDTFWATYSVEGRQQFHPLKVFKRPDALREAHRLAQRLETGEHRTTERKNIKMSEAIEKYLAWQQMNDRAPKTIEKYDYVLRRQVKTWWERRGDKALATFKADDYLAFKQKLAGDGMCAKTVADRLMILSQLRKWAAMKCDPPLIGKYPLANVALPKVPDKQQPCFSAEQVRFILANAHMEELPIYATFAYTGMRFGEARDLRWTDLLLNENGGTIYIRRGGSRKDMTKSGKNRAIPISPELLPILKAMPRLGENVFYHPTTAMYPWGTRSLDEGQLLIRFKRLCKSIGFADWKKAKLHTFRHFFASVCAMNNVSYKFALRWLGHGSSDVLDLYFHMHDREAQSAMNGLNFTPMKEDNAA